MTKVERAAYLTALIFQIIHWRINMTGKTDKTAHMTTGVVAFSNVTEYETYQGKSTGRYSLVVVLDDAEASKLEDMGVKLREYEGKKQRKFASKFDVLISDLEDHPVAGEIPYGSTVRVLWTQGDVHPQHGMGTFLERVRVLEFAETGAGSIPDEF